MKKATKAKRTRDEIMAEYGQVAAAIGDAEYRLKVGIPALLADLYERAKALNLEAAQAAPTESTNG